MRKRAVLRYKRVEEMVNTETGYIAGLEAIINDLRKPLMDKELITPKDNDAIFANIDSIYNLHMTVHKDLVRRFEEYTFTSKFGDIMVRNAPFFKIYIEYLNKYLSGSNMLKDMAKTNPEIQAILAAFQAKHNNDAGSFLIKPVQRFMKYHVILEPILKETNPEHPDHALLTSAYDKISTVVQGVNEMTNRIMNSIKLNELDIQFKNEGEPIYDRKRELLFSSQVYWISKELQIPVDAYFFTDMILLVSREEQIIDNKIVSKISEMQHTHFQPKILLRMKWNNKTSSFQDVSDGKTMRNIINLSTESGPVTISTRSKNGETEKQSIISSLNKCMVAPKTANFYAVEVRPLGTEELNSTSLSKHTIYIIEVKIGEIRQNLYIRFKEMVELADQIQIRYPQLAKKLPSLNKKWLDNHRSKTIETRKLAIMEFLQAVLNDKDVRADPTFVVNTLKLRDNFYDMPKLIEERIEQNKKKLADEKHVEPTALDLLCCVELKLGRYSYHFEEQKRPFKGESVMVDICLMTSDVERITITEFDTVEDVCNKISRKIGLNINRDFRLFHEIGKKESRALDHDQVVMKLFDLKDTVDNGFFSKIKSAVRGVIMPDTRPILVFKKYYYLPHKKEQEEYRRDLVRLRLLVYQVFTEIREHKYQLTFDEYCFFGALLVYLINSGNVAQIIANGDLDISTII